VSGASSGLFSPVHKRASLKDICYVLCIVSDFEQ
jgi:hypothetical protein